MITIITIKSCIAMPDWNVCGLFPCLCGVREGVSQLLYNFEINKNCSNYKVYSINNTCYFGNETIVILDTMEAGSSGNVLKVRYNNSIYALKQFTKDDINERKLEYDKELNVLSYLQITSSVVRLYGYQNGKYPCILMEYIENGDLIDFMKRYRKLYTPSEIANISLKFLKDIGNALYHLNEINHIHMDVKPENILYNMNKGRFYLTDFAFVKSWDIHGKFDVAGTDSYLSPEHVAKFYLDVHSSVDVTCIDRYTMV